MTGELIGWKTWVIFHRDHPRGAIAAFQFRSLCEDYLKLKREQALFEAGCENESVRYWNKENFIIDYSVLLNRSSMMGRFNVDLSEWVHD